MSAGALCVIAYLNGELFYCGIARFNSTGKSQFEMVYLPLGLHGSVVLL